MGINLPCGNKPLTTNECGGDCDEKIERLAERVSEAEEKLDTIQEGAEVNVNADWEETDPNSDAYIENKPSVNYDLSLGDSAPTVGSAVVGSAVLGSLVDIILGRGDGTEDRVSVSGTGAIQITRDGDTMTIHVPVGEIDQLRNGTDTEARAWAANVLKQWLDERIAQIPADQFLDLNKTVFANPFTWSSTTYPGSINPNLDGKPVLVLALTDGENVSYSFLNMEDLIDAYEGVAPISVNGSQISHDNSGVTAGSYGDSSNQTPNFGDTFKALRSTVDAKGHVTSMSEHTVKIPDTLATQESAGLMSAEDKEKLDNVDQLYKTTCGNPIVIDDADGAVKSLNVELTPIQDLHGYDKPWAAGAINKIDTQGLPITITSQTIVGTYFTTKQTTWTASVVCTNNTNIAGAVNLYVYNGNTLTKYKSTAIPVGATNQIISATLDLSTDTITELQLVITGASAGYSITVSGAQINEDQPLDQIYPYENNCPIYPHTSLPVRDTGVNQWDEEWEIGSYSSTGQKVATQGGRIRSTNMVRVLPSTTYYMSGGVYLLCQYDEDGNFISFTQLGSDASSNTGHTVTTSANTYFVAFATYQQYGTTYNNDISINYPSTDHDYHPYTGQTVTVPLNDLYGGSVDVIGGSGKEKWAIFRPSDAVSTSYGTSALGIPYLDLFKPVRDRNDLPAISTEYEQIPAAGTETSGVFKNFASAYTIYDTRFTSASQAVALLESEGFLIAYTLDTPTPLTTTPTPLTLYKGDNVVSSNGDMCITYLQDRGDLTDFINEMKACCEEVKGSLLENLVDGTAQGSLRGIDTAQEDVNYTLGTDATALGNGTKASGDYSVAEGTQTEASGLHSHAEGVQTKAMQQAAHAEGAATTANALFAHSEGNATNATGLYAHAEGGGTTASGESAHAEGGSTTASAQRAHAEGGGTTASGLDSHAEGSGTTASGDKDHAEGYRTTASGGDSHAEGAYTAASGLDSHAEGNETIANHLAQHVFGEYNIADASTATSNQRGNYVEIVGNGAYNARSNARTLDWNGNEALQGTLTLGKGTSDEVTITAAQLQQLLALI